MYKHLVERFEREVRQVSKKDISLSKDSFYSGEQRSLYKRVVVDGKETNYHVDLWDLQDWVSRGKVSEQVRAVVAQVILG